MIRQKIRNDIFEKEEKEVINNIKKYWINQAKNKHPSDN